MFFMDIVHGFRGHSPWFMFHKDKILYIKTSGRMRIGLCNKKASGSNGQDLRVWKRGKGYTGITFSSVRSH